MQRWQYRLLVTARLLYMFRTLSASIIRSTKTVIPATGACHGSGRYTSSKDVQGRLSLHYVIAYLELWHSAVTTDLGHPYWIYVGHLESKERLRIQPAQLFHCN